MGNRWLASPDWRPGLLRDSRVRPYIPAETAKWGKEIRHEMDWLQTRIKQILSSEIA